MIGFLCLVALAADKPAGDSKTDRKVSSLVGTWEMVSAKYGDATEFSPPPSERKSLKFITPTHFIWVWIDPNKKVTNSMGGTCTHEGDSYIEKPEFAAEGMEAYLGKAQKFTAKVEGDKWTQSGELSDGMKLEEIWQRVK
jgi:hypothetical protein